MSWAKTQVPRQVKVFRQVESLLYSENSTGLLFTGSSSRSASRSGSRSPQRADVDRAPNRAAALTNPPWTFGPPGPNGTGHGGSCPSRLQRAVLERSWAPHPGIHPFLGVRSWVIAVTIWCPFRFLGLGFEVFLLGFATLTSPHLPCWVWSLESPPTLTIHPLCNFQRLEVVRDSQNLE